LHNQVLVAAFAKRGIEVNDGDFAKEAKLVKQFKDIVAGEHFFSALPPLDGLPVIEVNTGNQHEKTP
jgi:hypothetical protein